MLQRLNMTNSRTIIILLAALFLSIPFGALLAQTKSYRANYQKATIDDRYDLERAIEINEKLLIKDPGSSFAASVLFQLIELHYLKASNLYKEKMQRYEDDMARFDEGLIKNEPVEPRYSFKKAISHGYTLINNFPTAPILDKVFYRLAVCHLQERNTDRAVEFFNRLTYEYPGSPYVDEANFRSGEQYFDKNDYSAAIEYYRKLLNSYESSFFNIGLYKLGWSYYNLGNHTKAISTFIFLIDDLSRVEKIGGDSTNTNGMDLRREAITYVAESFSEHGGAATAERFLSDFGEKEYSKTIFIRLGEIYQERDFWEESNSTYNAIIRIWPLHHTAPEVNQKIINNFVKMGLPKETRRERDRLVATYGPGSEWLMKHPEGPGRESALKLSEENLYILATNSQKRGMEAKSKRFFNVAVARYQEYLDKFPESSRAPQVQFYQGESYYETGDFANAAKAYNRVAVNYDTSRFVADASYNRVLATFELLDAVPEVADTSAFYLEDFLGNGETHPVQIPSVAFGEMLLACNDFARFRPDDQRIPEVMMKLGAEFFNLKYYNLAQQAYTMVVNRSSISPFTVQAFSMIARCAYQQENYLLAEKWYSKIVHQFPDSIKYIKRADAMIASAKFKMAESLRDSGEGDQAAEAFQNVANNTENMEIAEKAILQAAAEFEKLGNNVKAVSLYENLRFKVPASSKVDWALYKAANLAEKLPDFLRAGENYEELIRLRPDSELAEKSLYKAALAYENMQNMARASQLFEEYVTKYNDTDKKLESLLKLAEYAVEQEDGSKAKKLYASVIKVHSEHLKKGKPGDEYYPAQAQFRLSEFQFEAYKKVQIKRTKTSRKTRARKERLFKQLALACKKTTQYNIADWTSASVYLVGAAFEEMAQFYINAPKPKLKGKDLETYENGVAKLTMPFKKKAIQQYQANIQLSQKSDLANEWIEKSRERLEELNKKLGLTSNESVAQKELNRQ